MARFEIENYIAVAEDELKSAKVILALAATPLLFFLSALGYLGDLSALTKSVATASVMAFAVGAVLWGFATVMCQLSIVSVRYQRMIGVEGEALRAFAEKAWNDQNNATAKLFWPAAVALIVGLAATSAFVLLVIWVR